MVDTYSSIRNRSTSALTAWSARSLFPAEAAEAASAALASAFARLARASSCSAILSQVGNVADDEREAHMVLLESVVSLDEVLVDDLDRIFVVQELRALVLHGVELGVGTDSTTSERGDKRRLEESSLEFRLVALGRLL